MIWMFYSHVGQMEQKTGIKEASASVENLLVYESKKEEQMHRVSAEEKKSAETKRHKRC